MDTLETLTLATIMSLLKDVDTYEDLENTVQEIGINWVLERMIKVQWREQQLKKKKTAFEKVHRQLVSRSSLSMVNSNNSSKRCIL